MKPDYTPGLRGDAATRSIAIVVSGGVLIVLGAIPSARRGIQHVTLAAIMEEVSAGKKAALTRKRRVAAFKAQQTRKRMSAFVKARAAEASSKEALRSYCEGHGWRVAFFEGPTGSPRTGVIDAIMFRVGRRDADILDLRLVQLKGGKAGVSGSEIARLKKASQGVVVKWLIAAFDGEILHLVPEEPVA